MMDVTAICQLYAGVLNEDIITNGILENRIREGIKCMNYAYSSDGAKLTSIQCSTPDFNDLAFRCAYLHKYAPLHTYVVRDVMLRILGQKAGDVFQNLINSGEFKLCCLGGGPGTDVIGIIAALYNAFRSFKSSSVTVVDCKRGWEVSFKSLIRELRFGSHGDIWNFQWRYVEADLLQGMTHEANLYISSASLVTMIKFVSAASCTKAEMMVERIFKAMKPGALLLYIDNGAGGYTQVVDRASKKYGFEYVIPALRHLKYENENFRSERFGYTSCFKTTVTVLLLKKPSLRNQNESIASTQRHLPKSSITHKFPVEEDNWSSVVVETDYKFPLYPDNLNLNLRETDSISHKCLVKGDNLNRDVRIKAIIAGIDKNRQGSNTGSISSSPSCAKPSPRVSSSTSRVSSLSSHVCPSAYRVSSTPPRVSSTPPRVSSSASRVSSSPTRLSSSASRVSSSESRVSFLQTCCPCCVIS